MDQQSTSEFPNSLENTINSISSLTQEQKDQVYFTIHCWVVDRFTAVILASLDPFEEQMALKIYARFKKFLKF